MKKKGIDKKQVSKMLDKAIKGVKKWDVKQDKRAFGKIVKKRAK